MIPNKHEDERGWTPPEHAQQEHPLGPVDERDGHHPFPIVGMGASAGGLEAFSKLLSALSANTGMAFVLVQHLDPHRESRLTDLLGRTTRMPVVEATHGMAVERNQVYIIP